MQAPWRTALAVGALGGAAELVAPHKCLGSDAYMALACGRFVAHHGLPHVDAMAVRTAGTPWVDQQWLGQLTTYAIASVGGLWLALAVYALLVGATLAICARSALRHGASENAVFIAGIGTIVIESSYISLRTQMFSMVAFAALLALVRSDLAQPSRRIHLVWPLLVLWANVHGAIVLGAALVGLRGARDIMVRGRRVRGALIAAGAAASPFATPYALEMPSYWRHYAAHVDPHWPLPVMDWIPPRSDWASFLIIAGVAALAIVPWLGLGGRPRLAPPPFETLVLALLAFAGLRAARNMAWFALALCAYGPTLIDRLAAIRTYQSQVLGVVTRFAPALLAVAIVRLCFMPIERLEQDYPDGMLPSLRSAMATQPNAHVVVSDIFSDWALWHVPELEGRVEMDSRLELLTREQAREVYVFLFAGPGFLSTFPDAPLALIAGVNHPDLAKGFREAPGAKVIWEGPTGVLLWR